MDLLSELYYKSAAENEKNLRFWENYLQNLKSLDFSVYSDKLKVPTLVPIGSRILFRGEIKHTNEVTVALGADYFVKCSIKQAEILRQHRIKDAQSKLDIYIKEKEYLENQMTFTKKSFQDNQGKEIIEYYSEEDDKQWRQQHRENVRKYKQNKNKEETVEPQDNNVTDEELWERLEELELQEELENELTGNDIFDNLTLTKIKESNQANRQFTVKEEDTKAKPETEQEKTDPEKPIPESKKKEKNVSFNVPTTKLGLLQQVIDKQNELEEKLYELKNKERTVSKNESDLMARLDELEQLDELEDEMDRLDDIIENEDTDDEEEDASIRTKATPLERRVSFVDEDDSETIEITFDHSSVEPNNEAYDPKKGIKKPSDVYEAHSNLISRPTSILKKSKYEPVINKPETSVLEISPPEKKAVQFDVQESVEQKTIVVKDVVEKVKPDDYKLETSARPTSLFKKKRMQNKS
ncbi:unnamed protein product [Chrysodeixis includens]|uniref:Unconventional prefoldin RPB5 interactor n=1 Tax=Chrysodeixis includens TaxID=689277 RepID=A0A9P0BSV9_CHRIL|nr:unnamed protein product [Chrysodeixis includens]